MSAPRHARHLWLWLLLPLIVGSALRGLWAPDEPRYAEVAREVFSEPGLAIMRLCGEVYPDKPPLLFWLAGLFGLVSGWAPFAMRLVSLLATVGTALLVRRFAARHAGARAAALAPAFYLGTAMVTEIGARLQIDPLLTLLTTFAILQLDPTLEEAGRRRRARLAGLAMGLGMLAKGPIAVLVPLLVGAAWRFLGGGPRRRLVIDPLAILLALAPVSLWVARVVTLEPDLAGPLLFGQHLGRLSQGGSGMHHGPPWEHLVTLPGLVAPWTFVFLVALFAGWKAWRTRARRPDPALVLPFLWFAVLFVFFSVIPPKRNLYLLPAYPAIGLLLAVLWARWEAAAAGAGAPWLARTPALIVGFLGVVLAAAGLAAPTLVANDPKLAAHLETVPGLAATLPWRLPLGAAPLVIGAVVSFLAARRGHLARAVHATLGGWALGAAAISALFFPALDTVKCARDLAQHIDALHAEHVGDEAAEVPCFGIKPEGLRFYAPLLTVDSRPPAWMPDADLPKRLGPNDATFGPRLFGAVLRAWKARDGARTFAVIYTKDWHKLEPDVRAEFRVLAEDRLGSKELFVLGVAE